MGFYEMAYFSLYMLTAAAIVVTAFLGSFEMWNLLEEREEGAAEGFLGRAVSWGTAIKFVSMGSGVLMITYYSIYSMGQTIDNLISWIDIRGKIATECSRTGNTNTARCSSMSGTALAWDLNYHTVTVVYGWFLYTFIMGAAHWLASNYIQIKELDDCDLDGVDESYYSDVRSLIAQEVDIASCKNAVKQIFRIADLSGNGHIDKCENAKFLYGLGNSQKYALNYNEEKSLALLYSQVCYSRFSE